MRFSLVPLLAFLSLPAAAFAQNGLIIYRDAPWDQDQFAHGVLYKKVSKFSTVHNIEPVAGTTLRVNSSLVVKDIPFPTVESLRDIEDENQVKQLEALIADWNATLKKFPQVAKTLKPHLVELQTDVAQFHSGKVKSEGVWMSPDALVAKKKKTMEERQRIAAKLEEESKRRQAMAAEWEQLDEAGRQRAKMARSQAELAQLQADEDRRVNEEIKRQEEIAAKRAQMKPAERLATDTWVTPPGLKPPDAKDYEDTFATAKASLEKAKDSFGFGNECQRFVLATPERVYAFKAKDVLPEITVVTPDEKSDAPPQLVLSCPSDKKGIDSYPVDGSEPSSVASITIPTPKGADSKKLAETISHLLELTGAKKPVEETAQAEQKPAP